MISEKCRWHMKRFERVWRYILAGCFVTAFYSSIVTVLLIFELTTDPTLAAAIASVVAAPVSYFTHRGLTYPDVKKTEKRWKRFAVVTVASFAVVTSTMKGVDYLHGPFWVGLIIGWVMVPLFNYLIFSIWVFRAFSLTRLSPTEISIDGKEKK